MKIEFLDSFVVKLNQQVSYIAADKPKAARKFKNDLLQKVKLISDHPYQYRKSIYFENEKIRDLVFKGYTIVYRVDEQKQIISVFALIKHEEGLLGNPQKSTLV
ncbi:Plasmid stabilization system protein ParE [Algoriphagus faecimaris]|uniref:Plasmid stabilization system protein ParE n=1 Tax=Algoriphagus faecimaris TaxID=686796 RepID=A0A1G6WSN0_9BACT|nr:type II toxin-antitoxin system RelE/ParE family toxin [Algoriphagus faecimaris]SDD68653.1 Plasmid stabilization system protein ParE [Algoriphagus faecimaris]